MIQHVVTFNKKEYAIIKTALKHYVESMTEDYTVFVDDFEPEIKLLKDLS